jgi:hypothetical protein
MYELEESIILSALGAQIPGKADPTTRFNRHESNGPPPGASLGEEVHVEYHVGTNLVFRATLSQHQGTILAWVSSEYNLTRLDAGTGHVTLYYTSFLNPLDEQGARDTAKLLLAWWSSVGVDLQALEVEFNAHTPKQIRDALSAYTEAQEKTLAQDEIEIHQGLRTRLERVAGDPSRTEERKPRKMLLVKRKEGRSTHYSRLVLTDGVYRSEDIAASFSDFVQTMRTLLHQTETGVS